MTTTSEGRTVHLGKESPLGKLASVIEEAVNEALASISDPGIRDRELVRNAVELRTIRERLRVIKKKINELKPQEVKDLEKEAKLLKDELNEKALGLETRIAGDAQIRLDEGQDDEEDEKQDM